jgi:hypothetical protein
VGFGDRLRRSRDEDGSCLHAFALGNMYAKLRAVGAMTMMNASKCPKTRHFVNNIGD